MTTAKGFARRTVLIGAAAGAATLAAPMTLSGRAFAATAEEANRKVNISGRQRMLTQRMSRAAVYAALGIEPERHIELLEVSRSDYAKALDGLNYGDADLGLPEEEFADIRDQIGVIEELWFPFESKVRRIVDRGEAKAREVDLIAETNVPLLKESNTLVEMLVKTYGGDVTDMGRAVALNIAGRQRMLSQKMTKECGLIAYGYEREATTEALGGTMTLFENSLAALMQGNAMFTLPRPPEEVWTQLEVVRGLWGEFKPVVQTVAVAGSINEAQLGFLAQNADPLLANMHKAVNLYEVAA